MRNQYTIDLRDTSLELGHKTLIMGILNVTPDSFSDGGKFVSPSEACEYALEMVNDGADIIDIGGESTRPGSESVNIETELKRVIPVIEAIRKRSDTLISIDTYKAEVAREAISAGADIVNDISAGFFDPEMKHVIVQSNVPAVLMHIKGTPKNMQKDPSYTDIIEEISSYFMRAIDNLKKAGIKDNKIIIDPGIGFGKTTEHNLYIMNHLDQFSTLNRPILMGVSRKSVIGNILNLPTHKREFGTAATVAANIIKGTHIIRVHDVEHMKQVAQMTDAILSCKL